MPLTLWASTEEWLNQIYAGAAYNEGWLSKISEMEWWNGVLEWHKCLTHSYQPLWVDSYMCCTMLQLHINNLFHPIIFWVYNRAKQSVSLVGKCLATLQMPQLKLINLCIINSLMKSILYIAVILGSDV